MTREGYGAGEQPESPKVSSREALSEALGQRIYRIGERMRLNALEAAGVGSAALPEGTRATITLAADQVEAWIETHSLQVGEASLRLISLVETDEEKKEIYRMGCDFRPDGTMRIDHDPSQGEPWSEDPFHVAYYLADFANRLGDLANSDYGVNVNIKAQHRASEPYAVSA